MMVLVSNYNAFELACFHGDLEKVQALLPATLNYTIDFKVSYLGETPLILAIKSKQISVVQYLLSKGADPQFESNVGRIDIMKVHEGIQNEAPLYVAAAQGTPDRSYAGRS